MFRSRARSAQQTDSIGSVSSGQLPFSISNYTFSKSLGNGAFGEVKLGLHNLSGERVAAKVLLKSRVITEEDRQRIRQEVDAMKQIQHVNIIRLFEVVETEKRLVIVMEFAPEGELFKLISSRGRLPILEAQGIFRQLACALDYLHAKGIAHRDVKCENILLEKRGTRLEVKLADFGLAKRFTDRLTTACGSPCYAPPEMILGKSYHPPGVDWWSAGVVLFAMLNGSLPFDGETTGKLYRNIVKGKYEWNAIGSREAKAVVTGLLTVDPTQRWTGADLKRVGWLLGEGEPSQNREQVLRIMEKLGFSQDEVKSAVQGNRHNQLTTTFWLLAKKFEDELGCRVTRSVSPSTAESSPELRAAEIRPRLTSVPPIRIPLFARRDRPWRDTNFGKGEPSVTVRPKIPCSPLPKSLVRASPGRPSPSRPSSNTSVACPACIFKNCTEISRFFQSRGFSVQQTKNTVVAQKGILRVEATWATSPNICSVRRVLGTPASFRAEMALLVV